MINTSKVLLAFLLVALCAAPIATVYAQETSQEKRIQDLETKLRGVTDELQKLKSDGMPDDRLKSIEDKIQVLADEIENIKSASVVQEPTYQEAFGLAPAASKVYFVGKGLSLGGYGELAVTEFREDSDNVIDALRVILYAGYKFTDRIVFNSEIEFEHGTTGTNRDGQSGSVSVEFATLDFFITDYFNLRGGLVLVPFGTINEVHEPTTFFGVLRPEVERLIIPSTWRENGAGIFGEIAGLDYRVYVINSFDSRGFRANENRGARTSGNRGRINDPAAVGRVEYDPFPGLRFGGSFFIGQTGQNESANGEKIDGLFQMYEADVQFQWAGLETKVLFVYSFLDDADLININNGLEGNASIGEEQYGFYVEAGYNLLSLADFGSYFEYLAPFVRYEKYDTQREVPSGFERNPANDRETVTVGVNYKPIKNVVIKADYSFRDNEAGTATDAFNLGLGYVF
ncbi:MAG: hypothetical protein ACT4NX_09655 [Deltaproteobacteria bacterium]